MTERVDADERRSRPSYRVGVWLFRIEVAVTVAYVIAVATRAVPLLSGPSFTVFILLCLGCAVAGYVSYARAGVRIFALALVPADGPLGHSDEVKANQKVVWRDVFGLAPR